MDWQPIETVPKDGRIVVVYSIYELLEKGDDGRPTWVTDYSMETAYWYPQHPRQLVDTSGAHPLLEEADDFKIKAAYWRDLPPPDGLPVAWGYMREDGDTPDNAP